MCFSGETPIFAISYRWSQIPYPNTSNHVLNHSNSNNPRRKFMHAEIRSPRVWGLGECLRLESLEAGRGVSRPPERQLPREHVPQRPAQPGLVDNADWGGLRLYPNLRITLQCATVSSVQHIVLSKQDVASSILYVQFMVCNI